MPYKDPEKQKEAQKRYEEQREKRYTTWLFIFYEDSAPSDWKSVLSELQVRFWVSPVHDRDVWTASDEKKNPEHKEGKLKKPHRHGIVQFEHSRTLAEVQDVIRVLNGPTNIKRCEDLSASVRYLIHKDDSAKAQYDRDDVLCFGGADPEALDSVGKAERYIELNRMRRFIREHDIVDLYRFVDYCDECESRWARLLDDSCIYPIERYIGSRRAAKKDGSYRSDPISGEIDADSFPERVADIAVDPSTGEVVGMSEHE